MKEKRRHNSIFNMKREKNAFDSLTDMQKEFVIEYIKDFNLTEAYIRAGYNRFNAKSHAQRLLKNERIQEAVEEAKKERLERLKISNDYVLRNLQEIVERSMQKAQVLDKKGQPLKDENGANVWKFDAANASRALELLGKHLGMFTDKIESKVDNEVIVKWEE